MLVRVLLLYRVWFTLGRRDFVMRFRRMRLGVAWQFVTLTLLLLAIGVIYGTLFKTNIRTFLVFLAASLILWFYLTQTMDMGCGALIGSEGYIKQLPVPPLTYAFRAATASTLSFIITIPAFFIVKLFFQPVFWWWMLWALPGLICFMVAVTLISASLSYLNARFRDVQPAVSAFMQIMFYVTPMIYSPDLLAKSGHAFVYLYNPLFHLINIVRGPMLGHTKTLGISWAISGAIIVALMVILLLVIRRYDRRIVYYL
jgi:ABC-type polysaccharide/polyol phosphate export permease